MRGSGPLRSPFCGERSNKTNKTNRGQVGLDAQNRQTIVVWDISRVEAGELAPLVARDATVYNVRRLRFSPLEQDRFVTCGRDSIRLYRIKGGQLRGCSVQLGPYRTAGPQAQQAVIQDKVER